MVQDKVRARRRKVNKRRFGMDKKRRTRTEK